MFGVVRIFLKHSLFYFWDTILNFKNLTCVIYLYIFVKVVIISFLANIHILYPLKTPENRRFSGVFRGYKMVTLSRNGLILTTNPFAY